MSPTTIVTGRNNRGVAGDDARRLLERWLPGGDRVLVESEEHALSPGHPDVEVLHVADGPDGTFTPPVYRPYRVDAHRELAPGVVVTVFRATENPWAPPCSEMSYQMLVHRVLRTGEARPDRTGTGTFSLFGEGLTIDLARGVPLLTTRRVPWRAVVAELVWFLRGRTDVDFLRERGVRIWDGNSSRAFLDGRGLGDLREGDIGAGYGFQFRHFGAAYPGCDKAPVGGTDQLEAVVRGVRDDPTSRRHVVTAWNPSQLARTALPPCHVMHQFYVSSGGGAEPWAPARLDCMLTMRSCDVGLGLAFNMVSYAAWTEVVARKAGLRAGRLVVNIGDAHVYRDHVEALEELLHRRPLAAPRLVLADGIEAKPLSEIDTSDFDVVGYVCHPPLAMRMSV